MGQRRAYVSFSILFIRPYPARILLLRDRSRYNTPVNVFKICNGVKRKKNGFFFLYFIYLFISTPANYFAKCSHNNVVLFRLKSKRRRWEDENIIQPLCKCRLYSRPDCRRTLSPANFLLQQLANGSLKKNKKKRILFLIVLVSGTIESTALPPRPFRCRLFNDFLRISYIIWLVK